jgi:hypothetical protein
MMYCVAAGAEVSFRRPILNCANLGVDFDHTSVGEKKLFRPGVLSRVWCLGPCDDLRGCEAVDLATQRSLRHTGAEISQEEFGLESDSDDDDVHVVGDGRSAS